ncbi:MAG: substrate-binding domain-containing protein, partial [Lentisphaeria bacterium]|nr:substrate-binding domain-containing protein [Lentisphaeria bacterium]
LRVPLDVGVVCFEATDWDALKFVPRLTAVEYDYTEIAACAVRMLQELMKTGEVHKPQLLVPERFTVRDTVIDRRGMKQ